MDHLRQQIGQRLKARRNALKLSLKDCAQQSQLSARYLIQAEAGEANLSINKLAQLCKTLQLRLAELLSDGTRGKIDTILSRLSPDELEHAYQILTAQFGRSHHSMIALLGLRGAGKSSVGQALAQQLGWNFVELDGEIELLADLTLSEIFALHGEQYYRRLESEALEQLNRSTTPLVIATGGSIVSNDENYNYLKRHSITVWLQAEAEDHWTRVILQGDRRPMKNHPHAMAELRNLLQVRSPLYAQAQIHIQTHRQTIEHVIHEVSRRLHTEYSIS